MQDRNGGHYIMRYVTIYSRLQ